MPASRINFTFCAALSTLLSRENNGMAAYIIVNVEVHDPERYEDYRTSVLPTLGPYGGRFLVRGGKVEVLEGGWTPKRFVIVEFPSTDKAREWWHSAEYAEPKALRQATSRTEMILVEGV